MQFWCMFMKLLQKKKCIEFYKTKYTFEKFQQTVIESLFGVQRVIVTCLLETCLFRTLPCEGFNKQAGIGSNTLRC